MNSLNRRKTFEAVLNEITGIILVQLSNLTYHLKERSILKTYNLVTNKNSPNLHQKIVFSYI